MTTTPDITPEHTSRRVADDLHPEVKVAYAYVDSVLHTADAHSPFGHYAWHGWAIREAFLAGCSHAASSTPNNLPPPEPLSPKEVEAQEAFTQLRDEILDLSDGLEVNEVLGIIDNYTPEWV